jgi:hypothetical protein
MVITDSTDRDHAQQTLNMDAAANTTDDCSVLEIISSSSWLSGWRDRPAGRTRQGQRGAPAKGNRGLCQVGRRTDKGRAGIENFFATSFADELHGAPKILHANGHSFSDVASKVVSIINLTSVAALEDLVDATVNPLRFRGNVYVTGWPAWSELDLVGKEVSIGAHARFKVVERIVRCAATNVDPLTGIRDLNIPKALMSALGHSDCGIYAEVTAAGEIAAGNEIEIV